MPRAFSSPRQRATCSRLHRHLDFHVNGCHNSARADTSPDAGVSASRRSAIIISVAGALAASCVTPADVHAIANSKTFSSQSSQFEFDYPEGWAIAVDRNGMQVPGTLAVAGDFNNGATLSVARSKLSDYDASNLRPGDLMDPKAQARLLEGVKASLAQTAGLFGLEVVKSDFPEDGRFFDMEFKLSLCRGLIIEGTKGRRRCVNSDDSPIPTPEKHIYQRAFVTGDGHLLSAAAGAASERWEGVGPELVRAARSFRRL